MRYDHQFVVGRRLKIGKIYHFQRWDFTFLVLSSDDFQLRVLTLDCIDRSIIAIGLLPVESVQHTSNVALESIEVT